LPEALSVISAAVRRQYSVHAVTLQVEHAYEVLADRIMNILTAFMSNDFFCVSSLLVSSSATAYRPARGLSNEKFRNKVDIHLNTLTTTSVPAAHDDSWGTRFR